MAKIEDVLIPSLNLDEVAAPATPTATSVVIYAKSDGLMYSKDDAGVETLMSSGPTTGVVFAANLQQNLSTLPWWAINSDQVTPNLADRCAFYPFIPFYNITVTTFNFLVTIQNGNTDMGIYDSSLTRLGSTGSFAVPATGVRSQAIAAAGDVDLVAGSLYYIAWWVSGTTARLRGQVPTGAVASGMTASATLGVCAYLNAAGSCPAGPVTPTGYDLGFVPYIALS